MSSSFVRSPKLNFRGRSYMYTLSCGRQCGRSLMVSAEGALETAMTSALRLIRDWLEVMIEDVVLSRCVCESSTVLDAPVSVPSESFNPLCEDPAKDLSVFSWVTAGFSASVEASRSSTVERADGNNVVTSRVTNAITPTKSKTPKLWRAPQGDLHN